MSDKFVIYRSGAWRKHWERCEQQRMPFVAAKVGPKRSSITVNMDPVYRFDSSWRMTEAQSEFIFSLYDKYVPNRSRGTSASGGQSVITIRGVSNERAVRCLCEIVDCLRDWFPPEENWLTFDDLCALEPELAALAERARSYRDGPKQSSFCANQVWYYRGLKAKLCSLVGWFARNPDLRLHTGEAYDLAYQTIYYLLPDCRNCGCLTVEALMGARYLAGKSKQLAGCGK
ncbi:MAG TPA: hypothetical protein VKD24_05885 [Candidatus Angelobacter sp.]|nr:hypothetical protein [Candidatus Angelobacter sp.]